MATQTAVAPDEWLTVAEFAERFRINKYTAYELVASGEIAHVRIGRSIRIPASALKAEGGRHDRPGE